MNAGAYTHTPEPWHVARESQPAGAAYWSDEPPRIGAENGRAVAIVDDKDDSRAPVLNANARRIVACVNACAGIDTERLESMDAGEIADALRERAP